MAMELSSSRNRVKKKIHKLNGSLLLSLDIADPRVTGNGNYKFSLGAVQYCPGSPSFFASSFPEGLSLYFLGNVQATSVKHVSLCQTEHVRRYYCHGSLQNK
jgi:hypothetical protein